MDDATLQRMVTAIDDNHALTNASIVTLVALVASIPGAEKVDVGAVERSMAQAMGGNGSKAFVGVTNIPNAFKYGVARL